MVEKVFEVMLEVSAGCGIGFVIVTHDSDLVACVDRRLVLCDGRFDVA